MPLFRDIKIVEYLKDPHFRNPSWAEVAGVNIKNISQSDSEKLYAYKAQKMAQEYESSNIQNKLADGDMGRIFALEQDLIPVLADMEARGICIDVALLEKTGQEIEIETQKLEISIFELAGQKFNINSTKQLQEVLFESLKLPHSKKNKTGLSVDAETLEKLALTYPIAQEIITYRFLKKLQNTYITGLLKARNETTGCIHTTFVQTQTSTGRLSSENPNLQNIPSGDDWSNKIKQAFIPRDPNNLLLVADYSQVELRILAALSNDETLIQTFLDGEDIHARTAHSIFNNPETITSDMRRQAKAVNFGVIYGISGFGLAKMLNISPQEASRYIDAFFEAYPAVKEYQDNILTEARKNFFVHTHFGRKRFIKEINDPNSMVRTRAEREAINMPIQGAAADIIKIAMVQIYDELKKRELRSSLLLQIHDELVLEVFPDEQEEVATIVKEKMEHTVEWKVPLLIAMDTGKNWKEAK